MRNLGNDYEQNSGKVEILEENKTNTGIKMHNQR